mmetsp:Transcript_50747/g.157164  ORF Transcript_50747/g.157164 Transcript_50747/m.157164 type:complete len:217 (-) Transcript_50747:105-755(-)
MSVVCSCDERNNTDVNSFSCPGFDGLVGRCDTNHVCDSLNCSVKTNPRGRFDPQSRRDVCIPAARCTPAVCDDRFNYFDEVKSYYVCRSKSCNITECCLDSATCDSYACSGPPWHGPLSNHGSDTLCHGPPDKCDKSTCCYCSAWNNFWNLGIFRLVAGYIDLDTPTSSDRTGGLTVAAAAAVALGLVVMMITRSYRGSLRHRLHGDNAHIQTLLG